MNEIERFYDRTEAEAAFGSCSAVRFGERVLLGGLFPIDNTGFHCESTEIYEQSRFALFMLKSRLERMGVLRYEPISLKAFITEPENYRAVGQAIGEYFRERCPAVSMLCVSRHIDQRSKVCFEVEIGI